MLVPEPDVAATGGNGSNDGWPVPPCINGFCWEKVEAVAAKKKALPVKIVPEFLPKSFILFVGMWAFVNRFKAGDQSQAGSAFSEGERLAFVVARPCRAIHTPVQPDWATLKITRATTARPDKAIKPLA